MDGRHRAILEACAALASALAGVAVVVEPRWIERLLGVEPDGGDGSLETWIAVGAAALMCCVLAVRAWRDARRSRRRAVMAATAPSHTAPH